MVETEEVKLIKISGGSQVKETAGCIVKSYEEGCKVKLRALGAASVNQMFKAMATSRAILAQQGKDVSYRPGYETIYMGKNKDEERTALVAYMDVK